MSEDVEVTEEIGGPDCSCHSLSEYVFTPDENYLRGEAVRYATEIIVSVNTTTAWVPQDTALFDMIFGFLKGQSVADPGVPPTDG